MFVRLMVEQEELIINCPNGDKVVVKYVKRKGKKSYIGIQANPDYKIKRDENETVRETDRE